MFGTATNVSIQLTDLSDRPSPAVWKQTGESNIIRSTSEARLSHSVSGGVEITPFKVGDVMHNMI